MVRTQNFATTSHVHFDETKVREVTTPRTKLIALPEEASIKEAIKIIVKTGHSRIPVYKGSLDHISGIVFAKDLLLCMSGDKSVDKPVKDICRQAFFSPESKSIQLSTF